jgi:hypothetical protein
VDRQIGKGEKVADLPASPWIEDILCTKESTTCVQESSKIIFRSMMDGHPEVEGKRRALGKLNMDEFAMGSSTENSGSRLPGIHGTLNASQEDRAGALRRLWLPENVLLLSVRIQGVRSANLLLAAASWV